MHIVFIDLAIGNFSSEGGGNILEGLRMLIAQRISIKLERESFVPFGAGDCRRQTSSYSTAVAPSEDKNKSRQLISFLNS